MARRKSSEEVINSTTFQRDFRNIAQKVHSGEAHYIVKISGLPVMAVIPIEEYKELIQEREDQDEERERKTREFYELVRPFGEELERRGISEEDLMAQLEKDKAAVYEKYYGDLKKKKK